MNPIDKACTALGLIEHLGMLADQFEMLLPQVLPEAQVEYETYCAKLRAVVATLDTDVVDIPIVRGEDSGKLAKFNQIHRLGIAGELVRLRATGRHTVESLAAQFDVPVSQIKRFFRFYDACSPSEKAKYRRQSIFEVSERLEDLLQIIVRQMARLEAINDEVHVKYVAEFRQTITLAANLIEKVNHYHRFQQLIGVVGELLVKELPHRQKEITEALYKLTSSIVNVEPI